MDAHVTLWSVSERESVVNFERLDRDQHIPDMYSWLRAQVLKCRRKGWQLPYAVMQPQSHTHVSARLSLLG